MQAEAARWAANLLLPSLDFGRASGILISQGEKNVHSLAHLGLSISFHLPEELLP